MLPKNKRVPRGLFGELLKSKKYFNTAHFTLRVAPSDEPRMAVSVSKKISKKAVVRNRVRRRVYSSLRDHVESVAPGLYLIIAKPGSESIRGEELKQELTSLIRPIRN